MEVALVATGAPRECATEGNRLARQLFLAAAEATDGAPRVDSLSAASELARLLARAPSRREASADVQSFVALTQSLPALLAGAWLALLHHPHALATLIADSTLVASSIGELLRLGSPAHAVFREARDDLVIGNATIRRGDRVTLNLWDANRDAVRFPDPHRLDLTRDTSGHLTFGTGVHRCAGAAIVRVAAIIATEALVARSASIALVDDESAHLEWYGGFALRAPVMLPVVRRVRE